MARSMRNRPVYNDSMNGGKQKQYDSRTLMNDAPYCQFCISLLKTSRGGLHQEYHFEEE